MNSSPKDALYEQFARIGKALGSPQRFKLIDLLTQGPRTVEALADEAGLAVGTASHHLQALRRAQLVRTEKHGTYVVYRVADEHVVELLLGLQRLAEARLAELAQAKRAYLGADDELEPVTRERLIDRVMRGEVTVLDVRPSAEHEAGHLPGARSVPITELAEHMRSLPKDREIVAYCRGPYCVYAIEAVKQLQEAGFVAHRLDVGVPRWRERGLPVEA